MTDDRWSRIKQIIDAFHEAQPDDPSAWIDRRCGEDTTLRREVADLLRADAEGRLSDQDRAVDRLSMEGPYDPSTDARRMGPTDMVGPYRLEAEIGAGGMGTVYRARRTDADVEQTVAVKLMQRRLASTETRQRFRAEQQVLASLNHPGIAQLIDGGVTDDGRPYLAMEHVDGIPITEYADEQGLGREARLDLIGQVAEVLQAAHRQLVIHRDLKPSNVFVTETASGPQVKLLDFGIAKLLGDTLPVTRPKTRTGRAPLTLAYAAPEQVAGGDISTQTDVYQLGVLAYELLAGTRPFDLEDASLAEKERVITEKPPTAPSAEASGRALDAELDTIVLKALRKEPGRRYASVEALAADLARYQRGEPVEARSATLGYRARKFAERNARAVAGVSAAVVLIVGLTAFYVHRISEERDRARREARKAEAVQGFLLDVIGRTAPAATGGKALTVQKVLDKAEAELESRPMQDQPDVSTDVRTTVAEMNAMLDQTEAAVEQSRRAYATGLEALGPGHPETLRAGGVLGDALINNGNVEKADSLFQALVPRLEQSDASPEDRSFLLTRYGGALLRLNRPKRAEPVLQEALSWHERTSDPDTMELARTHAVLGDVYREQGRLDLKNADYSTEERYRLAEQHLQRALTLAREGRASELKIAQERILNSLATLYDQMDKSGRAAEIGRRSLDLAETLYGPESGAVARALTDLSRTLNEQGKLAEADSLAMRAIELHEAVYGPSNYRTAFALFARAAVLQKRGQNEEASVLGERARRLFTEALGPTHPTTATMHGLLFSTHRNLEEFNEALRHGKKALKAYRAQLDDTDIQITKLQRWMGEIQTRRGRYEKAEDRLRAALEAQKKAGDEKAAATTRERLAKLYETWEKPQLADKYDRLSEPEVTDEVSE